MYTREYFQLKFRTCREWTPIYVGDYCYNTRGLGAVSAFNIHFNFSFIVILGMLN